MKTKQEIFNSLSKRELELIYLALEYTLSNRSDAEDELKEEMSFKELYNLQDKFVNYMPSEESGIELPECHKDAE